MEARGGWRRRGWRSGGFWGWRGRFGRPLSVAGWSWGLAVGGILGMAGTFAPSASVRGLLWGIDGVGIVMAGALLTVYFFRAGQDLAASGFLVLAIGEAMILSGAAMDLAASVPSFGAG